MSIFRESVVNTNQPPPSVNLPNINIDKETTEQMDCADNTCSNTLPSLSLSIQSFITSEPDLPTTTNKIKSDFFREKRFCFFKVSKNFGGRECWGYNICGWCEYHWMIVANITFLVQKDVAIDENNKVVQSAVFKAVFMKTISSAVSFFPSATRLLKNDSQDTKTVERNIASGFDFCRRAYEKEYDAICKAYTYMVCPASCNPLPAESEIARQATRRSWINDQKIILNSLHGTLIGEAIGLDDNVDVVLYNATDMVIFDSPILCLQKSSWSGQSPDEQCSIRANVGIVGGNFVIIKPVYLSYPGRVKISRELQGVYKNFNMEVSYESVALCGITNNFSHELFVSEVQSGSDMIVSIPELMNSSVLPLQSKV